MKVSIWLIGLLVAVLPLCVFAEESIVGVTNSAIADTNTNGVVSAPIEVLKNDLKVRIYNTSSTEPVKMDASYTNDFGSVVLKSVSQPKIFILSNITLIPVVIKSVKFSSDKEFKISSIKGVEIAPDDYFSFTISFVPRSKGTILTKVTIELESSENAATNLIFYLKGTCEAETVNSESGKVEIYVIPGMNAYHDVSGYDLRAGIRMPLNRIFKVLKDDGFFIGAAGHWSIPTGTENMTVPASVWNVGGGFDFGYRINLFKNVNLSIAPSLFVGLVYGGITRPDTTIYSTRLEMTPKVEFSYLLTRFFKTGLSAGYNLNAYSGMAGFITINNLNVSAILSLLLL